MKKAQHIIWLLSIMLFLGGIVAFTCVSHKSLPVDADIETVEYETDFDIDETVSYLDLLFVVLTNNWNADQSVTPVTFSSSAGFHCDKATGRNICIQFRKLKFDC